MGSGPVRQADDARHAPDGSTGCFTPHPPPPCDSSRSRRRSHAGGSSAPLRSAPQRGKGGSKGLKTAYCGPYGGFDGLTCI